MRICAMLGCSNGTYKLKKWKEEICSKHGCLHDSCLCTPPFVLYPFPTSKRDPNGRKEWIKAINRKDSKTGKIWVPTDDDRVCSNHFVDGKPTIVYPYPSINLGHKEDDHRPKRLPPKIRKPLKKESPPVIKVKMEEQVRNESELQESENEDPVVTVVNQECIPDNMTQTNPVRHDHDYTCLQGKSCESCVEKTKIIHQQRTKIEQLVFENSSLELKLAKKKKRKTVDEFVMTDRKVKIYTGLPNKSAFQALLKHVSSKAKKIRYWCGTKKVISSKVSRKFKRTPQKSGPKRKLTTKEELILVLLKLRLAIKNAMLADLFSISISTTSQILNTWIKFLSKELKPLIFWPSKECVQQHLPASLKNYSNLRCTIDCSEVFIYRPRDLEIQALTWSDYKKHNTVKFLVGIAPNGMITFLSKAWGGRASDQLITRESGFLDLVEPNDLILADRGFTIKEDLMMRKATLEIPPPSSGVEQMTKEKVKLTKKIANARIHVERAIGRMKWFSILQNVLPITLVPLIDDILVVCAALCNLLPPLVK